ncbi:MAG: DNA gyrase subunit A [Candidatus Pacebacteria bacterium CG_4_10_14_0_8_um_filter_43_12]|nr:MAG: DNA gyrase subunit A [Candidatus Pacebacteria bacterium CG_4_10_14_0_8_um_filter_43_12]
MADQDEQQPTTEETAEITPGEISEEVSKIGTIEESKYGKLKYISISDEMRKSYLDYAMSVIVARALPDVRDGLKPVHRRILYSMYKSGIHHTSGYKKSARIVGDVLGKYHPHGDAPVYMALVRLAQDFSMRYQLIDGQGNFGSVDGDSPAAMRYTEARLAKISSELLADLDKDTIPFIDNFDGSLKEPTVLPGKLPNLLLMGSEGIAVGMATKIPPHNLKEVCSAIIGVIDAGSAEPNPDLKLDQTKAASEKEEITLQNKLIDQLLATEAKMLAGTFQTDSTIDDIMTIIQGPDFPTGGIMYDFPQIKEAYRTGKGRVVIRAKASIEESKKGGFQIIVTELPYQVNKARLLMKIADLVRDKKVEGIRDLNDDSDRTGMQITIDLKRDARPKVVLNKLFKYSELQTTFPINTVALTSEGTPQLLNIRQILMEFIAHRQIIVIKRSQYELVEARNRAHILEGLLIALRNLDEVIATIRGSADSDSARASLMEKFGLSEIQATAILEMQLKRLAALERQKIEDEYKELQEKIKGYIKLLLDPKAVLGVIKAETEELISLYGDERKTKLIKGKIGEFSEEDLVPNEPTVITLTATGYVKRLNPSSFRAQTRGGVGTIGLKMKTEDMVQTLLSANSHDTLLLFTNQGRVFKLKAYEIPEVSRQAKGTAIVNLVNLKPDETIQSILAVDEEADKEKFISLATKQGLIKKTAVNLYQNIRQNGIIAIMLNDDDELVWGRVTSGKDDIMLITHEGKCIRFSEAEVKSSQRDTKGVKGITLRGGDTVIGVESISAEEQASKVNQLLVITEKGMGKRTLFSQYPVQKRSGMGVKVSDVTKRTGLIAAARKVTPEHKDVVISSLNGQTIKLPLTKNSIPQLTRPTQGVILMRLKGTDKVVAVTLTYEQDKIDQE